MKEMKRILAMVLCLVMVVGMVPMTVFAEDAVIDAAIFASDVHGSTSAVTSVFNAIKAADSTFAPSTATFVGDTQIAASSVTTAAQAAYTDLACYYAYGSHDSEGNWGIANETTMLYTGENYYVYTISDAVVRASANDTDASTVQAALDQFASDTASLNTKLPLFIACHTPLHARRCDNEYAQTWAEAINKVAASMDVVYLWGHNHTGDNEIDQAAYYVAKGSTLNVETLEVSPSSGAGEQESSTGTDMTINFTYMNAGYIGKSAGRGGLATTVKLYADKMVFQDYNSSGAYTGDYAHNETVSFEFADLSTDSGTDTDTTPTFSFQMVDVIAEAEDAVIEVAEVENVTTYVRDGFYYAYSIALENQAAESDVTVKLYLLDEWLDSDLAVYYIGEDGEIKEIENCPTGVSDDGVTYFLIENAGLGTYFYGIRNTDDPIPEGAVLSGIVVTEPEQKYYFLDEAIRINGNVALSLDGMVVKAEYKLDEAFYYTTLECIWDDAVTDGYDLEFDDLNTTGTKNVKVSYGDTEPYSFVVYVCQGKYEQDDVTIEFDTQCVESVAVEAGVTVDTDISAWVADGYVAYDIVPTYAGEYSKLQGEATIKLPIPEGVTDPAVFHVAEDGTVTDMDAKAADGYVTFTTDHFSVYVVGEDNVEIDSSAWVTLPSTSYVLDEDGVDAGGQYLIVASDSDYAMTNSISSNAAGSYGVEISSDGKTITVDSNLASYLWTFSGSTSGTIKNGSNYLRRGSQRNLSLSSSQSTTWTISSNDDGTYTISNEGSQNSYYLRYSSSFSLSTSSDTVRLYKYTEGVGGVAAIVGATEYTVDLNTAEDAALAAVKAGITAYYATSADATTATRLDDSALTWEWVDTYDGTTAGSYTVAISYNGEKLGEVEVKVVERQATSITADDMSGSVRINAGTSATTGTKLTVIYSENESAEIDVTVGMLTDAEGNAVSTATQGTYKNLTITYGGQTITGYTLVVNPIAGDNYPEYPKEGAVRVDKVSDGSATNFQDTGVVKVELSTTGVPYKGNGIDVIVVLDWTDSMDETIGTGTRKSKTIEATRAFVKEIMIDPEGNLTGNNVIIYAFNSGNVGHVKLNSTTTTNEFETVTESMLSGLDGDDIWAQMDTLLASKIASGTISATTNKVTVTKNLTNCTQTVTDSSSTGTSGGTTYGTPLAAVYNKFEDTTYAEGEERSQYCVFMSDGAPTRLDYYGIVTETQNSTTGAWTYNYGIYSAGTIRTWVDDNNDASAVKKELFSTRAKRELGVTFFSVGLGIDSVDGVTNYTGSIDDDQYYALASKILGNIASEPTTNIKQTLFTVTDEAAGTGALADAFETIAASIRQAGTNAYFVDTMGENFDLQTNTKLTDKNGNSVTLPSTDITVTQYTLIKRSQIGETVTLNGGETVITEEHVGIRTGESSVLETVRFEVDEDGTVHAYSTAIDSGATDIMVNGVICAKNFFYNTTAADVKIDTDGDGTNDYTLPAETFYWNIGTITESEVALSYYVYLTGAVEGEREAGDAYETNKSATLYYTNYLGNSAYKDTVSPVVAWESAVVSYAFYLVDATSGLPITNITTGATGSFVDSVKVTSPVIYQTVLLNNDSNIAAVKASDVLLEGYELFDENAEYYLNISTIADSNWEVTNGSSVRATTYVTNYGGDPTTTLKMSGGGYDYTNTVVYFAVKFQIQTINDAVVVDYGLPVDITVMGNDFFGNNGKLVAVGTAIPDDIDGNDETTNDDIGTGNFSSSNAFVDETGAPVTSVNTTYGSAEVNVTSEDSYFDGYVRYTPDTMNFVGVDKVAYCVQYTDPDPEDANFGDVTGYYYGEIAVIPATTVYYEDNFTTSEGTSYITYTGYSRASKDEDYDVNDKLWQTEKEDNAPTDVTQAEDRPGHYSSTYIDANNVYGYDSAYTNMTTWSMGSAKKIHVDANQYGTAEFTFNGTGFDVISMTDSTTGTLVVQVFDAAGTRVKSIAVDTYYGYQYKDGKWEQTDTAGEGIMQVPVMQISGLTYGQYTVKIFALYYSATDQTEEAGYDLYLDAIRIYDPINTSEVVSDRGTTDTADDITVESVYKQDAEGWPIYQELRNNVIESAIVSGETNGIVFVDGVGDTAAVSDYTNYGPNNELYLAPGQAIGFNLDLSAFETYDSDGNLTKNTVAAVQLGIKSADGNLVTYKIFDAATVSEAADLANIAAATVNTATDMYYDIYSLRHKTIVIANTGSTGILSLTDIKLTFTETPPAVSNLLYVTGETVGLVLKATTAVEKYFSPATFNVTCTNSAFVGNRVNVNVETSSDVAAITVNGVKYTKYYQNKATGKRYWAAKVDAAEAGDYEIVVVAYDAEGTPSDPATHTIEFTVPDSGNINISGIKDVVNQILSWLNGSN